MDISIDKQNSMISYLLGDLPETEAAQLEDSSFRNSELREHLQSVENDLIDEYVKGELSAEQGAKFERLFLPDSGRRQRVGFAKALAQVTIEQQLSSPVRVHEDNRTLASLFTSFFWSRRHVWVYGAAVLIIGVLIGSWWLYNRRNSQNELLASRQEREQDESGNTLTGTPGKETTPGQTQSLPVKEQSPNGNRKPVTPISPNGPTVATFILLPGTSRSESERTRLIIPSGRELMALKLMLEEPDSLRFRHFTAELDRADSGRTWSSGLLSIRKNKSLLLSIPVSRLFKGTAEYDLTLRARSAQGDNLETLGYYYLTIVRE